jgi:hypothetical protein
MGGFLSCLRKQETKNGMTKITPLKRLVRFGLCCVLVGMALFSIALPQITRAASLTQGYHSNSAVALGAIVGTAKGTGDEIDLTTPGTEKLMIGVVVDAKEAIVDLQPHGTDVRVALSGEVPVLVSNLTGDIKSGDNLVISPVAGIATRDSSDSKAGKYIASAAQGFSSSSPGSRQVSITLNDGTQKTISIGTIRAKLLFSDRPASASSASSNVFSSLGSKIAGKPINTPRLVAATAVFMTTFSLTGLLLHGSVKGSFISLGRNPLSKPLIINNLFKMVAFGFLIIIAGTALAYVILVA